MKRRQRPSGRRNQGRSPYFLIGEGSAEVQWDDGRPSHPFDALLVESVAILSSVFVFFFSTPSFVISVSLARIIERTGGEARPEEMGNKRRPGGGKRSDAVLLLLDVTRWDSMGGEIDLD